MSRSIRLFALVFAMCAVAESAERQRLSFDAAWRFNLADTPGAEQPNFADDHWRTLDVPHDWSIEGPFAETNRTGGAGAFLPSGIGWYRKHFTLPAEYASRRVFIEFDGVMANSDIWLNGFHLGHRPYGYSSFRYDLTGHLEFGSGKTNLIAVRADNSGQPASRWYTGAGIYRHVRLIPSEPVHFEHWGTFVSTPKVTSEQAVVRVQTIVVNQSGSSREVFLQTAIIPPAGGRALRLGPTKPVAIGAGQSASFDQETTVSNPQLWELDHPDLYRLVTTVRAEEVTADEETIIFGIREARFEAATGFWLNGKNLKLKGVCLHHDAGGLGTAVPLRAWERRLQLLKQIGCNAIRTAHNPPAPEFLDLCDRVGFLLMDETFDCWTVAKNSYDYHRYFNEWSKLDTRDMVLRDRNHPCVFAYSAGNEIRDTPQAELAKRILAGLVDVFHHNDPTRPVTQALFRPNVSHDYDNGLADLLDVIGQNYRENEILAAHAAKPERKILGTENGHDRKVWLALRDNPPYAGQFLWTGFDYLGESRRWPVIGAGSGLFDRTGAPRPRAFQRQSWWSDQPMVHIARRLEAARTTPADPAFEPLARRQQEFSDWTPHNTAPHDESVEIYSNCEEVELFLNGRSLGHQPLPGDASPRTWKVPFEPGTLKAPGKNKGWVVATHELRTASKPAKIILAADRTQLTTNWDDLAYVTATIADANDVTVPDAADLITFNITGPSRIIAVDSGDNSSHEPFQASSHHAYQGQCVAILRATASPGQVTLTASAPGLSSATINIEAVNPDAEK
ncbi:MAG TPA: glycoside hydrolase family 2 TIM barrel-domain containing protein [Candidatus Binatia bacterium]|nr:glycoside hydrolase family 2 TIM barrel-domain containing protein [Candidatus Binatia bacterium]